MALQDLIIWEMTPIILFWLSILIIWLVTIVLSRKSLIQAGNRIIELAIVTIPFLGLLTLNFANILTLLQYGGEFNPTTMMIAVRYGYGIIYQVFPVMAMSIIFILLVYQLKGSSTTILTITSIVSFFQMLFVRYPVNITFLTATNKFILETMVHVSTWILVLMIITFLITRGKFVQSFGDALAREDETQYLIYIGAVFLFPLLITILYTLQDILDTIGVGLAWFLPGMFIYPLIILAALTITIWIGLNSYIRLHENFTEIANSIILGGTHDEKTLNVTRLTHAKETKGRKTEFSRNLAHKMFLGKSFQKLPKRTIFIMIFLSMATSSLLVLTPGLMKFQELGQANEALNHLSIGQKPLDEYPVVLDNFRFVDRDLFLDLVDSLKLPEPPKSFRVTVLEEHAAIGKIDGKPAWVVPLRYVSTLFNPKTNYIAGYISMNLDNPIPENIHIKYTEMEIGPGLSGLRNLDRVVIEAVPDAMMSSTYYLIDPWKDGKPAWVVLLDDYTSWGVRIPDSVLIVHSDRTWERLTIREALDQGIPGVISEEAMLSMVHSATRYLRGDEIDPSSRGFLWLPSSPDVQENIENLPFYHRPHHFLLGDKFLGRDLYLQVRTGSKESVVSWLRINDSIYSYDLRGYSKGGLVGVNTPDSVLNDLSSIAKQANIGNIDVRYPKLYRVTFGNATLLLWVSLVIQVQSGQDRFAGAVFVDAANSRIKGVVTARLGESPETFKERFENAINLSYVGFLTGNETIGGETAIGIIENGTVLRNNWVLLQPDNTYAIVLYIQNNTEIVFVLVTEDSVATKEDFYTASILQKNDRVNIEARYDKDHQAWLAYKVEMLTS